MSSQITLAVRRLGAKDGGDRTRKIKLKNEANIKPNTEPTPKAEEMPGEGLEVSPQPPKPRKTENCRVQRRLEGSNSRSD